MANPWFRMYTDFLNDPKMISLAFEDQRHFIGILALKSDGAIDQACDEKLLDRIVAQRLWIDYAIISDVKKRLAAAGLIDESWQPIAWDKRQFKSDKDNTAAERQRRFKESRKGNALGNALGNGKVTRLDTDTDTDTEEPSNTDVLLVAGSDVKKCQHQEIIELYHQILPECHRIRDWTAARDKALKTRWRENKAHQSLDYWEKLFKYIASCPFLIGKAGAKPFLASLDWICKAENFAKIREGRYEAAA